MTTMTATAIITAVDRASAVFAHVGAAAQAAAGRFQAVAGQAQQVGNQVSGAIGVGALAGVAMLIQRTQEFQKTLAGVEIANIADNLKGGIVDFENIRLKAKEVKEEAMRLSKELNMNPTGIMKAGEAALKMGISAEKVSKIMEMSSNVHLQDRDISQHKAAEFLGTMGILFNAGKDGRDYNSDITTLANQWLGIANMSRTSASKMEEGLRQFAPLFSSFGEKFHVAAALVGAMSEAGLTDVESGTALKSLGVRMLKPTYAGMRAMQQAGFDRAQFMDLQAVDSKTAARSLAEMSPLQLKKGDKDYLAYKLLQGQNEKKMMDPEFIADLHKDYNVMTGANDEKSQEANLERITMALMRGGGKIQMGKIIEWLAKAQAEGTLTDQMMANIGEGRHLSRYKALFKTMDFYRRYRDDTAGISNEFTRSGKQLWTESSAGQWEGAIASMDRAMNILRDSSGLKSLISSFETIANKIAELPPGIMDFGSKALAAAAGLAAFGLASRGIAAGLGLIGAAMASPLMRGLMLGGGLLALSGEWGKLFEPTTFDPFGAPMSQFDVLKQSLGGIFTELGGLLADIGRLANDAWQGLKDLFGSNSDGSLLLDTMKGIAMAAGLTAASVKDLRAAVAGNGKQGMESETGGMLARWGVHPDLINRPGGVTTMPADWLQGWIKDKTGVDIFGWKPPWADGGDKTPLIRDVAPQAIDVKVPPVEGTMTGKMDVNVKVEVEGGKVTGQSSSGGDISGSLNTGKSMPDVGSSSGSGYQP